MKLVSTFFTASAAYFRGVQKYTNFIALTNLMINFADLIRKTDFFSRLGLFGFDSGQKRYVSTQCLVWFAL